MYESEITLDRGEGLYVSGFNISGTYSIELPAEVGCDTLVTLDLEVLPSDHPDCLIDAVNDLDESEIALYPNPTNGQLYIETEIEIYAFKVFDTSGRELGHYDLYTEDMTIDVSNLQSGVYILVARQMNGRRSVHRFVKL